MATPEEITVTLKFLAWQALYSHEKPFQIFIDIPEGAADPRSSNLVFRDVQVPLKDVRSTTPPDRFSLDGNGFVFRKHETVVDDFADRHTVETTYLPEVERVLRGEMDGVDRVFFFDWRLRKNAPDVEGSTLDLNDKAAWLRPATHVHIDQSPAAALNRIRSQLSSEADFLLKGRVRIVNVWRPLIRSVEDWPLAVCDGATVRRSDLVETDHVRRHYTGSTMYLQHNPEQQFYYMSKQGKDDVLIFKQFDSQRSISGQCAPHGSFEHPNNPIGVEPRASIEIQSEQSLVDTKNCMENKSFFDPPYISSPHLLPARSVSDDWRYRIISAKRRTSFCEQHPPLP